MAFSGRPIAFNPATGAMEPLSNITGLSNLYFVRVATTAALDASYSAIAKTLTNTGTLAALSIDSVSLSTNDKVLVKNQGTASQNGLYTVTTVGDGSTAWVLTRSADMDTATEVEERDWFWVTEGTTNADNGFTLTTPGSITLDSTSLTFSRTLGSATGSGQPASAALTDLADVGVVSAANKFHYSTDVGVWTEGDITAAGRAILDDATAGDQRTTLGLGSAATLTAGTAANNVVQLDSNAKLPAVDGSQLTGLSTAAGDCVKKTFSQPSPAVAVGDAIYHNGTKWIIAKADAASTADVFGVVDSADASNFSITFSGYISGLSGLTAGSAHFLSAATGGALVDTSPTTSGYVSKPVLLAITSSTGIVQIQRGYLIP